MIILNPIAGIFYLVHLGINIAMLFTVIRLILTWKHFGWLTHLDKVGRPLVDSMTTAVGHFVDVRWKKRLPEKGRLFICIVLLSIVEMMLTCFFNLCL